MIILKVPALPSPEGVPDWHDVQVEYARGRSLAAYLASVDLPADKVHHTIHEGAVIRPADVVTVLQPEGDLARFWRRLRRYPPPVVKIPAFEAFVPRDGSVIFVVPSIDGRNAGIILGVVGAVIGAYVGGYSGAEGFGWSLGLGALQGAMTGYAIGSTIGALIAPHQRPVKNQDGQTSYVWSGIQNDDRAGVPRPIMVGQRLVGGIRLCAFRRRASTVPVRVAGSGTTYDTTALYNFSETLHLLILIAGHRTWGPVGITHPDLPADPSPFNSSNKPDVRLNGQHYSNFSGTRVDWRTGQPGQSVIPGFDVVANTFDQAVDLTAIASAPTGTPGTAFTYTTVRDDITAFEVLLALSGLSHTTSTGSVETNATRYKMEYKRHGTSDVFVNVDFDGQREIKSQSRSTIFETRRVDNLPPFQYDIKLTWISADHTDVALDQWHVAVTGITEESPGVDAPGNALNYEGDTLLAITSVAGEQLSGGLPTVESVWRGYCPQVYDGSAWPSVDGSVISDGTGSIAGTSGSPVIIGTGTTFTLMSPGDILRSGGFDYPVLSVENDGHLTIAYNFIAASNPTIPGGSGSPGPQPHHTPNIGTTSAPVDWCYIKTVPWGVGSFAPQGRNPYWLAAAIARDKDAGCGTDLPSGGLLATAWKSAADYAAEPETVTPVVAGVTGTPYTEPRFQFDCYFDQQTDSLPLLQSIVATARGTTLFTGDSLSVGVDRPGDPLQVFNAGNIVRAGGQSSFNLRLQSTRATLNTYDSSFDDSAADYQTEVVTVSIRDTTTPPNNTRAGGTAAFCHESDLVAASIPVLRQALSFVGVTRRTQTVRETRFRLRQTFALSQYGDFSAWIDAITAQTYDVIGVQNDVPQWGYGGVVMPGSTASLIMLNRSVPFEADVPYSVKVRYARGDVDGHEVLERRDVADAAPPSDGSSYFGLFVTTPFSQVPQEGDLWFFGPVGREMLPARIVQIGRDGNEFRPISFVEQNNSLYDVNGPIVIPDYSLLPNFGAPPAPIDSVTASVEIVTQQDGSKVSNILIQWTRPQPLPHFGFYLGAKIEYGFDGQNYQTLNSVDGIEYRWTNAPHGVTVYFRVTPYSTNHRYNYDGSATTSVFVRWYGTAAPDVAGMVATEPGDSYLWQWTDPGREFQVEVRATDANWGDDSHVPLFKGKSTQYRVNGPSVRSQAVFVRAFDAFLNYSANSASATAARPRPSPPDVNPATFTRGADWIKVPVAAATDPEVDAIYIWASQATGFTPDATNRMAGMVPPVGGEFTLKVTTAGPWYFRVAAADAISDRLGDFSYSAEFSSQLVTPVNPSSVTLSPNATPSRRRASSTPAPGAGQVQTLKVFSLFVNFAFADSVNPSYALIGFQAILYAASGGDPNTPFWDSGLVPNVTTRSIGIPDLAPDQAATYVAAVRALYIGGLSSALVTSTGLLLDPASGEPAIRTGDDQPIRAYAEGFDNSFSVPTGFSVSGTDTDFIAGSSLAVNAGNIASTFVLWDVKAWANAYLDNTIRSEVIFAVEIDINTNNVTASGSAVVTHNNGTTSQSRSVPLINDNRPHRYRVEFTNLLQMFGGTTSTIKVDLSGVLATPGPWQLFGIGIAFDGFDFAVDGRVDRAISARDQFDKDPAGHGFFVQAPTRLASDTGVVTLVENNGVFALNVDGTVDSGYKKGMSVLLSRIASGTVLGFNDPSVNPKLPTPAASNKIRLVVDPTSRSVFEVAPAASDYPISRYTECTEVTSSTFRVVDFMIKSGTAGAAKNLAGSAGAWPQSVAKKSALALSAGTGPTVGSANNAWYVSAGQSWIPLGGTVHHRTVLWLAVQMPLVKKGNGSFYYAISYFTLYWGTEVAASNPMRLDNSFPVFSGFNHEIKAQTDGQIWRMPIVISPFNHFALDYMVQWIAAIGETGGGSSVLPTSAWLDEIDYYYINSPSAPFPNVVNLSPQDLNLVFVEEF